MLCTVLLCCVVIITSDEDAEGEEEEEKWIRRKRRGALILSPCLPLCFKHYITRDTGRNEGCSEGWGDGKNREEMEKANSGGKEVSSFF